MNITTQFFFDHPLISLSAITLFSLCIGSFFNVVIYRLPKILEQDWKTQCQELLGDPQNGQNETDKYPEENQTFSLAYPPSACPKCGHNIKPWENIPLLSYLFLRGKCSSCKTPISIRYPIIEAVTALLAVIVVYLVGMSWGGFAAVVFSWFLLILAMIDFDTQYLPDDLTYPLLWLGLLVNIQSWFTPLEDAVWGAVAGYLSLWSMYHLFKLITGKEGMGYGDFKLLAAIGAWLGWKKVLLTILLSSFVGATIGLLMILILGRDKNIPMPFGPYLAIAGWLAMMWGDDIISAYLGTFTVRNY